jgi:hypothetical protein
VEHLKSETILNLAKAREAGVKTNIQAYNWERFENWWTVP